VPIFSIRRKINPQKINAIAEIVGIFYNLVFSLRPSIAIISIGRFPKKSRFNVYATTG
jgi:hypothetical protein